MLLNEAIAIERGGERIYLAGIDDAHFYRVDNIEKAADFRLEGSGFGNSLFGHGRLIRDDWTARNMCAKARCRKAPAGSRAQVCGTEPRAIGRVAPAGSRKVRGWGRNAKLGGQRHLGSCPTATGTAP